MDLHEKLSLALQRCGYAPLQTPGDYQHIGAGAWHDAYQVQSPGADALVVRLRKQIIYGCEERWDPAALHADYAPVGLYYEMANRCRPGTCPAIYHYDTGRDLVFTLESYIAGRPLPLAALPEPEAFAIGVSLGEFFQAMHEQAAPLPGSGLLTWGDQGVCAASPDTGAAWWRHYEERAMQQVETLSRALLGLSRDALQHQTAEALTCLREERLPIALINRDITPENLITQNHVWVGLVDPVPMQESGMYYAAFFLHCYRRYLPALGRAPRYQRHSFHEHARIMAIIADGYEAGYSHSRREVRQRLRLGEWLWILDMACESYELLQHGLSQEKRLCHGDEANVAAALALSVRELTEW
ncbi:MAG: hypothetical protein ETSY1_04025 [Candidatus Entotheonella factor]|uniref:Aminoglycoside phosphotransferase domain-containing protein n=1 Tax=Entotheonella factor TaxID=1429438 RepID=W4LWQ5_ENTF1|nr:MAG: hypothetical protein ETSY1_04025 [Candidatus Entotheonella factor]